MLGALETWYRSSDLRTDQTVRKTHIYFIWMTVLQSAHGIINPGTWHKAESSFTPTSIQVISNDLHPQVSSCKKAQPMHDSNDISGKKKVSWKISHHSNKRTFQTPPDPCRNKLVTCEIWLVGSYSCPACYISFEGLYWSGIIGPPVLLPIHTRNPANKIQHATQQYQKTFFSWFCIKHLSIAWVPPYTLLPSHYSAPPRRLLTVKGQNPVQHHGSGTRQHIHVSTQLPLQPGSHWSCWTPCSLGQPEVNRSDTWEKSWENYIAVGFQAQETKAFLKSDVFKWWKRGWCFKIVSQAKETQHQHAFCQMTTILPAAPCVTSHSSCCWSTARLWRSREATDWQCPNSLPPQWDQTEAPGLHSQSWNPSARHHSLVDCRQLKGCKFHCTHVLHDISSIPPPSSWLALKSSSTEDDATCNGDKGDFSDCIDNAKA